MCLRRARRTLINTQPPRRGEGRDATAASSGIVCSKSLPGMLSSATWLRSLPPSWHLVHESIRIGDLWAWLEGCAYVGEERGGFPGRALLACHQSVAPPSERLIASASPAYCCAPHAYVNTRKDGSPTGPLPMQNFSIRCNLGALLRGVWSPPQGLQPSRAPVASSREAGGA